MNQFIIKREQKNSFDENFESNKIACSIIAIMLIIMALGEFAFELGKSFAP